MSNDIDIRIKVTKEGAEIAKTTGELTKMGEAGKKTVDGMGKLDSVIKRAAVGLNKLGQEIPIVGYALNALKNPFTIVAAAVVFGIAKFQEYSKTLGEMVSNTDHASKRIKISADSYSDAAVAVAAMATAMKDLRDFTKHVTDNLDANIGKLDEQFAATGKLIEAEAELAKVRLDRDEPDPVKRAQAKASIDNVLSETKLGLSGKKGQQAALVEKQRSEERQLQVAAVAEVPSRESLVASVSAFESSRVELEDARNANRQAFGKAELLRRFVRKDPALPFHSEFSAPDFRVLKQLGLTPGVSELGNTGLILDDGRQKPGTLQAANASGRELLVGAEAAQAGARDRLGRAQSSFNSSRGSLPAGIAQLSDIDPFLNKAETQAAGVANESYRREESLLLRRDSLLRGQAVDVQLGKMDVQRTQAGGQISVRDAEAAADKAAAVFEKFANRLESRLNDIDRRAASQSQNSQ